MVDILQSMRRVSTISTHYYLSIYKIMATFYNIFKRLSNQSLLVLLVSHFLIIFLFMFWRLVFFFYFYDDLNFSDLDSYLASFAIGMRLDFIVSSFLMLPILFSIYIPYIGWDLKLYRRIYLFYLTCIFLFINIFCSINLEWYNELGNHLNTMIILYGESKQGWDFILQEYNIPIYIFVWLFMTYIVSRLFLIAKRIMPYRSPSFLNGFLMFVLSFIVTGVLIRGGFQERPLDWGYAYFSDSNMANSAAQNPIFFFGRSYIEMEEEEKFQENFLKIDKQEEFSKNYAELRKLNTMESADISIKVSDGIMPNLVLIILESFVSENCNFLNPNLKQNITPFLTELTKKSISFSNCYANGIRSAYGLGSILTSWPVLPGKPIISQVESGFSNNIISKAMNVFPDLGYKRIFLCGTDTNFDNMKGFCTANGFDEIIDINHNRLGNSKDGTMWGVFDHIMLDHLIEIANSESKDSPFMITFFSTTNHDPFKIPNEYENKFTHISTGSKKYQKARKTMAYNDFVLSEFFNKVEKLPWYKNTIFIITADHGLTVNRDIPNHPRNGHIPFIIYSDLINKPYQLDKIVSQVDIMPTFIDLINQEDKLDIFYGISGLRAGPGFACRLSNETLQWITQDSLYYEIMGKDKNKYYTFSSIWEEQYKELVNYTNLKLKSDSNSYIKNAYFKFKMHY